MKRIIAAALIIGAAFCLSPPTTAMAQRPRISVQFGFGVPYYYSYPPYDGCYETVYGPHHRIRYLAVPCTYPHYYHPYWYYRDHDWGEHRGWRGEGHEFRGHEHHEGHEHHGRD